MEKSINSIVYPNTFFCYRLVCWSYKAIIFHSLRILSTKSLSIFNCMAGLLVGLKERHVCLSLRVLESLAIFLDFELIDDAYPPSVV